MRGRRLVYVLREKSNISFFVEDILYKLVERRCRDIRDWRDVKLYGRDVKRAKVRVDVICYTGNEAPIFYRLGFWIADAYRHDPTMKSSAYYKFSKKYKLCALLRAYPVIIFYTAEVTTWCSKTSIAFSMRCPLKYCDGNEVKLFVQLIRCLLANPAKGKLRHAIHQLTNSIDNLAMFLAGVVDGDGTVLSHDRAIRICINYNSIEGQIITKWLSKMDIPYEIDPSSGYIEVKINNKTWKLFEKMIRYMLTPKARKLMKRLENFKKYSSLEIQDLLTQIHFKKKGEYLRFKTIVREKADKLRNLLEKYKVEYRLMEYLHHTESGTYRCYEIRIYFKKKRENLLKLIKIFQDHNVPLTNDIKQAITCSGISHILSAPHPSLTYSSHTLSNPHLTSLSNFIPNLF